MTRHNFFYALPAFVLALPTIPLVVLLPTFYGEDVGLGLATVGSVLFIIKLLDVISDPLIGWISDHIPYPLQKRKLPILLGSLLGGVSLYFLFTPSQQADVFYLGFWGACLYLGWTAVQIPYLAWSAELETDYQARNRLNSLREGFGLLGILGVGLIGVLLADQNPFIRFETIAWITIGLGIIFFSTCLKFVPQGVTNARARARLQGFQFPFQNKLFLRVLSAWFINGLANAFPAVCLPLYLSYILGADDRIEGLLLFTYFLCAILGLPFWLWLSKKHSKHRIWCYSMVFACLSFSIVPFLGQGDYIAFGIICALTGIALGSDLALPPSIQSDCADYDRYKFHKDRLASLFAYWSMSTKLALGLGVGIAFPLLDFTGLDQESDLSMITLIVIYAGLPIVLKICAVWMMWRFPLDQRKQRALVYALEKRSKCV